MTTTEKIVNDDNYVNNLLLKIAANGENSGKKFKTWCRNNWILISTILTVCVMAPIYFIWGVKKARINNF